MLRIAALLLGLSRRFLPVKHIFDHISRNGSLPELSIPPIFAMGISFWVSQVVYVAAKLGIADELADRPKACGELAAAIGVQPQTLFRLMRAPTCMGVFIQCPDGRFGLTEIGESLRTGIPGSMRSTVIMLGEEHYQAWGKLIHSVKTGQTAFSKVFNEEVFSYLDSNARAGETFGKAMAEITAQISLAVLLAYDFSDVRTVIDVGGGEGRLLEAVLDAVKHLRGVLFDSESVIESIRDGSCLKRFGSRCRLAAGDFFQSVPQGADVYLLKNVVHDWDDRRSLEILGACHLAMRDDSKLLLIETVVAEGTPSTFDSLLDLNMLVISGGCERTEQQFRSLLTEGGFRLVRILPTLGPVSILEAVRIAA
jgi:hypothetical protein